MRYLRVWRRYLLISLALVMEYRVNFLVSVLTGLVELGLAVLTFVLMFRFTNDVAGWSRAEVLMLAGVYRVVDALITLQVSPNMHAIPEYVQEGQMDFVLLWPVSSRFTVSVRLMNLPALGNLVSAVALIVYAGNQAGVRWSPGGVAEAAAFMLCGVVLLYCLWFLIVTCSFWLVTLDTISDLFYGVFEAARYPVSFFRGVLRVVLTFAVPVAFATTFPTQSLLGAADTRLLAVGVVLAAAGLVLTQLFWSYAVRHYSSASS